ncbi:hypothetical protein [Lentzea indica]|uniref:hypothetical protein n=1 Tax=Lentzea indica TaxID=2604800 RepID=UPI0035E46365
MAITSQTHRLPVRKLVAASAGNAGIGAWYNLTVALFGGTAPLVIQAVGGTVFFWYVAVISFLVILTLPETKGVTLR